MSDPTNTDNTIDSRDVIERLNELRTEREELDTALTAASTAVKDYEAAENDDTELDAEHEDLLSEQTDAREALASWDEDNSAELKALAGLNAEGEECGDWQHGETLIRDTYFEKYARETARETGSMTRDQENTWPFDCIDWEKAALQLQMDYTSVDFDGQTYWIRS